MASLRSALEQLKQKGVQGSTWKQYSAAWNHFTAFLAKLDEPVFSWEDRLMLFVVHMVEECKSPATIRSHLTGIRYLMRLEGIELQSNNFLYNVILKVCNKLRAESGMIYVRIPLTECLTKKLVAAIQRFPMSSYDKLLYSAVICTAYYGLFRIGEVIDSQHAMRLENMQINPRTLGVKIKVTSSKTMRPGDLPWTVKINKDDSPLIPVNEILHSFWQVRPSTSAHSQFFVKYNRKPLSQPEFRKRLSTALKLVGLPDDKYNTHSFRIGRATDLFRRSYPLEQIKRLGRWKSDSIWKYIR